MCKLNIGLVDQTSWLFGRINKSRNVQRLPFDNHKIHIIGHMANMTLHLNFKLHQNALWVILLLILYKNVVGHFSWMRSAESDLLLSYKTPRLVLESVLTPTLSFVGLGSSFLVHYFYWSNLYSNLNLEIKYSSILFLLWKCQLLK